MDAQKQSLAPREPDQGLVVRTLAGDEAAKEELCGWCLPCAVRIASRMLLGSVHEHHAEDWAMESVEKMLEDFGPFSQAASFPGFFKRSVHNHVVNRINAEGAQKRDARVTGTIEDPSVSETVSSADPAPALVAEVRPVLSRALRSTDDLGADEREAVARRFVQTAGSLPVSVGLACMAELPRREREAFELRHYCEMEYEDIAREMGFNNPGSARNLVSRARTLLGNLMRTKGIS